MNLYQMRREFDTMLRTSGLTEFDPLRDAWLNQAWEKLSESFVIPALERNVSFASVVDVAQYAFPYDYNGTETCLYYNRRRLDPVPEKTLKLRYEKRNANAMGPVWFYDWGGTMETDLLVTANVTLTNKSKVVTIPVASTNVLFNSAYWVRFDPYEDADAPDKDVNGYIDPGDYGHLIEAGTLVNGMANSTFSLQGAYRGPSGTKFTMRLRPAETQKFTVYGTPAESTADIFELDYSMKPKRLFNDEDTPEWPSLGLAIVYMAISIAFEWHQNMDLSKQYWGRAMSKVEGLKKRAAANRVLVTDLTVGSAAARKTGIWGTTIRRYHR
jgi:hypothetical protein